jgi:hypothetical protein
MRRSRDTSIEGAIRGLMPRSCQGLRVARLARALITQWLNDPEPFRHVIADSLGSASGQRPRHLAGRGGKHERARALNEDTLTRHRVLGKDKRNLRLPGRRHRRWFSVLASKYSQFP